MSEKILPCPVCGRCVMEEDKQRRADYASLASRHRALVEAVAWRKECELVRHYVIFEALKTCAFREITKSISAARAEVDRLLEEGEG